MFDYLILPISKMAIDIEPNSLPKTVERSNYVFKILQFLQTMNRYRVVHRQESFESSHCIVTKQLREATTDRYVNFDLGGIVPDFFFSCF